MRTFEEIKVDIDAAVFTNNVESLRSLAQEMHALGSPEAEALSAYAMATAERLTGHYRAALERYQHALAIQEELGDTLAVCVLKGDLAIVHTDMGDYPIALQLYEESLAGHQEHGDRPGAARVIGNMASLYKSTAEYQSALRLNQSALALYEELADHHGIATVLGNIGSVHLSMGEHDSALKFFHRALDMFERMDDRVGVARVTNLVGNVHSVTGDYALAMEAYRRALAMYEALGNAAGVAMVLGNIGNIYGKTGDYANALEHYRRALTLHTERGQRADVARVLGNIGILYAKIGDNHQAMEQYQRGLVLQEEIGDRAGVARLKGGIGSLSRKAGDHAKALQFYREALTQYEELGNLSGVAYWTGAVIGALYELDRVEEAAELLAKQASMKMEDPIVRTAHFMNASQLAAHRTDLVTAKSTLIRALDIASEHGLRQEVSACHLGLRDLAQKQNDFAAYIEHNNAYNLVEEEIRGKETMQKLAILDVERTIEAERREREKEKALLYGALPESVATRMLRGEDVSGDHFENVSVLFLDIAGFTTISDRIPPRHVVHLLKAIFKVCDEVCRAHGLTKIKTIGDSYLAVGGVPEALDDHVQHTARAALDMLNRLGTLELTMDPKLGDTSWTKDIGDIQVRIGLHCGPLVAGIVGEERLQYDVWGDTVNVASRMESTGEPGRIHVSESFAHSLTPCLSDSLTLVQRGEISIKGKGPMTTYWLEGA